MQPSSTPAELHVVIGHHHNFIANKKWSGEKSEEVDVWSSKLIMELSIQQIHHWEKNIYVPISEFS